MNEQDQTLITWQRKPVPKFWHANSFTITTRGTTKTGMLTCYIYRIQSNHPYESKWWEVKGYKCQYNQTIHMSLSGRKSKVTSGSPGTYN